PCLALGDLELAQPGERHLALVLHLPLDDEREAFEERLGLLLVRARFLRNRFDQIGTGHAWVSRWIRGWDRLSRGEIDVIARFLSRSPRGIKNGARLISTRREDAAAYRLGRGTGRSRCAARTGTHPGSPRRRACSTARSGPPVLPSTTSAIAS